MTGVDPSILALYKLLDLIGVVLNGAIGGTIARQRNFDIIGFAFLAIFSALAGGMLRDTLMQRGTAAAIAQPSYMGFAILGALLALAVNLQGRAWELFKVHGDAIILGVWAVTGAIKALSYGMPPASAIFMGVLTAVGGGMIRDIAIGEVPSVFGGNTLYATPAIAAASTMVAFHYFHLDAVGMITGTVVGAGFAIIAYWRGWVLPMHANFAPVNMTAAQLKRLLRQAENRGQREGMSTTTGTKNAAVSTQPVQPTSEEAAPLDKATAATVKRVEQEIAEERHEQRQDTDTTHVAEAATISSVDESRKDTTVVGTVEDLIDVIRHQRHPHDDNDTDTPLSHVADSGVIPAPADPQIVEAIARGMEWERARWLEALEKGELPADLTPVVDRENLSRTHNPTEN